jgi:endoglucanase
MDMKLFERICNTPGVSGFEDDAQDVVAEALRSSCDEVSRDRMGNVIGLKKATCPPKGGKRPLRAILAAHVDEIGAMVKHIDDKGFIRFIQVGGLSVVSIISQRVVIHGKKPVRGVVVPDMRPESKDKVPTLEDLRIDTGLSGEAVRELVDIGDIVTFDIPVERLNDKVYVGRNFDNRLGVYCMIEAMRRVGKTRVDVYAVSTVQEEVGLRGIPAAAFAIEPDVGLAIDGSYCWGAYGDEHQKNTALGKGTGIYIIDALTIGNRRLVSFLYDICSKAKIPFQKNIGGGTDASGIQKSRAGVPVTTVGAPTRYMHSTVQLCHDDDVEATIALLAAFLEHAHEFVADSFK